MTVERKRINHIRVKEMGFGHIRRIYMTALILVLSGCVCLSGCKKRGGEGTGGSEMEEEQNDNTEAIWNYGEEIGAVVDGEEITAEEIDFYAYCQQANYEAYSLLSYRQELNWGDAADESGETMEEKVKKEIQREIERKVIFSHKAKEWNVTLTQKEEKEVEEKTEKFLKESDKKLLERSKADSELVKKIYTRNALYEKVYKKIGGQLGIKVTQEEAKQAKITAVELSSIQGREKTKEQLEKDASAILKMAKRGKTLKIAAQAYGYSASTGNVGKGDMSGNELEQACLSMKTGEYKLLNYLEYVYVLYCDSDFDKEATELAKEEIKKQKTEAKVTKIYESWQGDIGVEWNQTCIDNVSFDKAIFTIEDVDKVQNQETSQKK